MLVETHITLLIFSLLVYSISSKIGLVGKIRHEAISSLKEGEPSSASKIVIIAHQQTLDCYCPTITVLILNCYCPTSPHIFNNI
jgi:hypothetical protein